MLRSSVSLALLALLTVTAANVHAGSTSDNIGSRSGSPGSGSSEGNDQMAVSGSSAGTSSASSTQRGASGSGSGSYQPRVNGTATNRFDRAGLALSAGEPVFTLPENDKISVYVLKNNVDSEAAYHRLVFRMYKLVDYFVYQTQGLPSQFKEVTYNGPGYDMVIMYVDSPEDAGKATPQLKRKVAALLKTKLTSAVAH